MFDKPRGEIPQTELLVIQVMPNGNAIAVAEYGTVAVLFLAEGESYYDSQKIIVPEGKVCSQVGTYRYTSQNRMVKTIPVVIIMDKWFYLQRGSFCQLFWNPMAATSMLGNSMNKSRSSSLNVLL